MGNAVAPALGAAIISAIDKIIQIFSRRQPAKEACDDLQRKQEKLESEIKRLRNEVDNLTKNAAAIDALEKEKLRLQKLEEACEANKIKLGIDNVNKFNYAVTGHAGVGKSSLVNAFLGLESGSQGAAEVGVVECTSVITPFPHPKIPRLVFWDLPGAGTIDHPISTYYEDKALHAFDAVLIVIGNRILEVDLQIAKQTQEAGKPVVFVRSKADLDIQNLAIAKDITMAQAAAEFRDKVKKNFQHQMLRAGLTGIDILIVSSFFFSKKIAYKLLSDTSLKCMDEKLAMDFLLRTGAARFHDLTGGYEAHETSKTETKNVLQIQRREAYVKECMDG